MMIDVERILYSSFVIFGFHQGQLCKIQLKPAHSGIHGSGLEKTLRKGEDKMVKRTLKESDDDGASLQKKTKNIDMLDKKYVEDASAKENTCLLECL